MKKFIPLLIIFLFSFPPAHACDICGCGVGGSYIGILPEFSKRIMGFRYRYNGMVTHLGAGGVASYLTSRENYRTMELWGGWNINKKFRLMASIPFSYNQRENQGETKSKNGVGDISVSAFYNLFHSRKMLGNKLLVQALYLGAGIKLPTGKYNPADKQNSNDAANLFQLGTGSTDFNLNMMYDLRLQDAGLNVNAAYKMNTTNKYAYSYGNKLTANAQLYYKFKLDKNCSIAPNAGVVYEHAAKDIDRKFDVDISGGNILLGTIGIEAKYRKAAIGANFQPPLSQDLANGFVKAKDRFMLHVAFML